MNHLQTYKKFYHLEQAEQVKEMLADERIAYDLITPRKPLDTVFVGDVNSNLNYEIRILGKDFKKADEILQRKYKIDLSLVEDDYYLFDFSDEELYDVVLNFDQWNLQDYHLAKSILKKRGKDVNQDLLDVLHQKKQKAITGGEKAPKLLIFAGYLLCILGSPIGFLLGIHILTSKKTLPDGSRVHLFDADSRDHGLTIFVISLLVLGGLMIFYIKATHDFF